MTTNQKIDGVPRELLCWMHDFINDGLALSKEEASVSEQLRALLAKPAADVDSEQWWADTPDGEPALVTRVGSLTKWWGEPVGFVPEFQVDNFLAGRGRSFSVCPPQWSDTARDMPLYTRPAEQPEPISSTSDKYKAELYDEVWQLARGMGYGNVTDALMKLQGNKP
ncbi:hypothetical protein [Pseudomonas sp. 910_21]|uniref:hypothetical protein n=1 Tax=Pseudomonas sp. 910_21 TaxID=2604460 RepID=UPI004062EF90